MDEAAKKLLVIDDHNLFRDGLISLFRFTPDFTVVGSAGSVFEGIRQAHALQPDIILMDFSLPDGTGLDATQAILAQLPDCQIVFLTMHESDEKLFAAIRLGARGYLLKSIASADLLSSLRSLTSGEMAVSRLMLSHVVDEFNHRPSQPAGNEDTLARLSPREKEILREMISGDSNLEIAQRFFLSENTVKHHVRSIFEKLGVKNRHEAALFARHLGPSGSPNRSTII